MATDNERTKAEAPLRELVDRFTEAIRAKDIDGVMSVFASEIVSFDLGPPLQHGGGETFTKRWQELFESYESAIDYEVHGLEITVADKVAFSHSLNKVSGTLRNGHQNSRWLRWTACYRKDRGKWMIAHEHVSVPVDVRSEKAMLGLEP